MYMNMKRLGLCVYIHKLQGRRDSLPHSTYTFSHILNSFNPVTGEKYTPSLQSALKIDPTDSTHEVKKVSITEVGPGHPIQPTKPRYVCALYIQAIFTAKHHYTCCIYTSSS